MKRGDPPARIPWRQRGGCFTIDRSTLRGAQEADIKREGLKFVGFMLWQYLLHGRNRK